MWALNGSAFIISLALARQGRTEEAALLAEGHHERHAWMGTTDAVYRGMALSIACAACGRQGEALAHAHEAAQDARSTDSNLYQSLCAGAPRSAQHSTEPTTAMAYQAPRCDIAGSSCASVPAPKEMKWCVRQTGLSSS